MRSIGTSYAGICKFRGVSTALEVWEEHNLILIRYGGLGRTLVGIAAQFCFLEALDHSLLVQWLYILTIFCTVYPRLDCSLTLISVISSIKASRI